MFGKNDSQLTHIRSQFTDHHVLFITENPMSHFHASFCTKRQSHHLHRRLFLFFLPEGPVTPFGPSVLLLLLLLAADPVSHLYESSHQKTTRLQSLTSSREGESKQL